MDWADLKAMRQAGIEVMQKQLEGAEPVGLPLWAVTFMMLPVFLFSVIGSAFRMTLSLVVGTVWALVKIVLSPFMALYLWVDLFMVVCWFYMALCRKLSGEEK